MAWLRSLSMTFTTLHTSASPAAGLTGSSARAGHMALAYASCAAAGLLAGGGSPAASLQGALLLAAVAAALTPGLAVLAAVLAAKGSADWPPGALLLVVSSQGLRLLAPSLLCGLH